MFIDCPTQLICALIFISSMTKLGNSRKSAKVICSNVEPDKNSFSKYSSNDQLTHTGHLDVKCVFGNFISELQTCVDLWVFSTATNNESRGQFVLGLDKCLTLGVLALHLPNA